MIQSGSGTIVPEGFEVVKIPLRTAMLRGLRIPMRPEFTDVEKKAIKLFNFST